MKAVMTVEASWIFGITLIVIYIVTAFSFGLYTQTYSYIKAVKPAEIDAVTVFKMIEEGTDILHGERT